jgi:hypothetical protein
MTFVCSLLALLVVAPPAAPTSLDEIRREPDARRRFERAIAFADAQLLAARQLVRDNGLRADLEKLLATTVEAAQLALDSLRSTGLRPSKLSRQYKKGEVRTREFERLLGDLALALSVEDRPTAEKARDQIGLIHEEFLLGVMSK